MARWEAPPERLDPVALLERQARTRIPELVPIRYGRMLASPFAFFRGLAAIMAADLATTPTEGGVIGGGGVPSAAAARACRRAVAAGQREPSPVAFVFA
jgi:hypothetical protein